MKKRVALITGGSRGIGYGVASQLAGDGFDLAINGVRAEEEIGSVLDDLRRAGAEAIYCRGNLASADDRKNIMQKVQAHFGRLHVLVNNAGMAPRERRDILQATEESFDEVLSANLKGAYFLTQDVANWFIAQKQNENDFNACIVTISSISATMASVNRGEYCISKAGLAMMTQLYAARLGEFNIPVYEVRPGVIATDMTSGVKEKYDKLLANGLAVQERWGTPEDVGKAVSALASGKFPYSTGQIIMVDGGITIPRL
jgi:3-oxoacyl-[acyl-carrier protein] reductase